MSPVARSVRNRQLKDEAAYLRTLPEAERSRRKHHKVSGSHGASAVGYLHKGGAGYDKTVPVEVNLVVYPMAPDPPKAPPVVRAGDLHCPHDGYLLLRKAGKHGHFLGCASFPRCFYTWADTG